MAARRNGRALAVATTPVRCAIYTRKSTDEGLDRDFNSLDNQRARAEAYAASQEGWHVVPDRYDDGGFSGGTADRPALRRLLADAEAGRFEALVVYRLDRLSRSLRDFLGIHEFLDKHGVALVSTTESINTGTPHGRMMVNVLLSFAQYERELAGERTRDKIHSARRRGKWTGGTPPLGFDLAPEGGRLVVNRDEAATVRAIFDLYVQERSLTRVVEELNRRGWRRKSWTTKDGKRRQGGEWDCGSLRRLLTDPVVVGRMRLGDETFRGEHDGIVPKKLFNEVERLMEKNRRDGGATHRNRYGFLLRGLLRCSACDRAMTPVPTKRGKKLYRYYRCQAAQKQGAAACPTKSISADRVEAFVVEQIRRIGTDPQLQEETFRQTIGQVKAQRRGLRAEKKRLDREIIPARREVERLVDAVSRTSGQAAEAVAAKLEDSQSRVATIDARQREIENELADLKAQDIDREHLARALQEFDPIWDVLLTPEKERVLSLLIEKIDYDGSTQELRISWRLAGFGQLASEVSS